MSADPTRLALAKEIRVRNLTEMSAVYEACNCTYPLDTYRNGHSHAGTCAAVPILEAQKAAREARRLLASR